MAVVVVVVQSRGVLVAPADIVRVLPARGKMRTSKAPASDMKELHAPHKRLQPHGGNQIETNTECDGPRTERVQDGRQPIPATITIGSKR